MTVKNILKTLYKKARIAKYRFLSDAKNIKGEPHIVQPVLLSGEGNIVFGGGVFLGTEKSPFFYSGYSFIDVRKPNANITFGDGVWSNNNLTIISQEAGISIGANTIIGSSVEIYDSDFHAIDPKYRKESEVTSNKVIIGENVWIGSNVKILKGVTIGSNAIIGNNAVVTKNVSANSIWGGVPAVFLKDL